MIQNKKIKSTCAFSRSVEFVIPAHHSLVTHATRDTRHSTLERATLDTRHTRHSTLNTEDELGPQRQRWSAMTVDDGGRRFESMV